MKAAATLLGVFSLALAALPAQAGRLVAVRAPAAPVVAPAALGAAAVLAAPGALTLEAPRLAPVGASLSLPVAPALAVSVLQSAPAQAAAQAAAPNRPAAVAIKAAAPASPQSMRGAENKQIFSLAEKGAANPADKRRRRKSAKETALDQIQNAAKIADSKPSRVGLDAFARVFDGGMERKPTPVWTDDARRDIGAKTKETRDYLKETDGLEREALLLKLRDISGRGYQSHSYKAAKSELFSNIDNFKFEGRRGVMAAYSQVFVPGHSGDGSSYKGEGDANGDGHSNREGMNTEHLWPQSYFNSRTPMVSDVHHLMATFIRPNSERSRYPFGEVPDSEAVYRNSAGAKLGNEQFEPPDIVKGRVARGMLYFMLRYGNRNILPSQQARNFWNSRIAMFMRWHQQHPPGVFERRRNDLAEAYQGNRNPFVDAPELVGRIGEEAFTIQSGRGRRTAGREREQEMQYAADTAPDRGTNMRSGNQSGKQRKNKRGHSKKRRKHRR